MILSFYSRHKKTFTSFSWRFLQLISKQGINFLIFLFCARLLTPYDFGIYSYTLAIIFFLVIFSDFGISIATSKYIAEYIAEKNNKVKHIIPNSMIVIFLAGILILGFYFLFEKIIFPDSYKVLRYALPLIFLIPLTSLYDGAYRGLMKFKKLSLISISVGFISLGFIYIFIRNYGVIGAIIAQNLFYFILLVSLFSGIRGYYEYRFNKEIILKVTKYSVLVGVASLGYYLYSKVDILILGKFNYIEEIAYYEIINKVFMLLVLPFTILGQVIAPQITKLYTIQKEQQHIHIFSLIRFKSIFVTSVFLSFAIYFIFPLGVEFFFPAYFTEEMIYMIKILIFVLPAKAVGVYLVNGFLTPTGHVHILSINTTIFGILNVIFDIIFISFYGYIGVIYSTLLLSYISLSITVFVYHKKLKNGK